MEKARKKELVQAFKEEKPNPGIFAVRCTPTGAAWVDASPNLSRQQNGVWFRLRMGGRGFDPALGAAWKEHGEEAFAFEVLEEVRDENALLIHSLLKDRTAHWRKELGASALIG